MRDRRGLELLLLLASLSAVALAHVADAHPADDAWLGRKLRGEVQGGTPAGFGHGFAPHSRLWLQHPQPQHSEPWDMRRGIAWTHPCRWRLQLGPPAAAAVSAPTMATH